MAFMRGSGSWNAWAGPCGCGPASPMVTFNYELFRQQFPVFNYVNSATAQTYFNAVAVSYVRNDGGGPVCNSDQKLWLMNLMVAHMMQLFGFEADGNAPSTIVGRINSASEGSVNVGTEYQPMTQAAAWYLQTPYGAAYWEAIKPFRSMRYRPGPVRNMSPWPFQ